MLILKNFNIICAGIVLFLAFNSNITAQTISYILPDIGSPGMNTHIEMIAPHDSFNNFGTKDTIYYGINDENVKIVLSDPADTNIVTFGPLIVGWEGRMISTQVFVNPLFIPDSDKWDELTEQSIVRFRVSVNNNLSNEVAFYVVNPFQLGDIDGQGSIFGEGNLGIRSPRGAMIVDSLYLGGVEYSASLNDCDPVANGNQGYLPFILLSKGPIKGRAGSEINVDADRKHAGPGGGGGGGHFCDVSGNGGDGGDGYTGGGPGGFNSSGIPWLSDSYKNAGNGSGEDNNDSKIGGNSMNGVPGGKVPGNYESSGGGTGHPFGLSGEGSFSGTTDDRVGGYGGGSGYTNDGDGGSGGYASVGNGPSNTPGKVHGNSPVVPLAGGSGGASGNPQAPTGGCSGDGGGGGGAMLIFASEIRSFAANAIGGDRQNSEDGDGGNGSGGYVGLFSKSFIQIVNVSVAGGSDASGGAGRHRYDALEKQGSLVFPTAGSKFRGISTDSSAWLRKDDTIRGSIGSADEVIAMIKGENSNWQMINTTRADQNNWYAVPEFNTQDSVYYFLAIRKGSGSIGKYDYSPEYIHSQAAANIIHYMRFPELVSISEIIDSVIICPGWEWTDSLYIYNKGDADLILNMDNAIWDYDDSGYELLEPLTETRVAPGDSVKVKVKFHGYQDQYAVDYLMIPHNDREQLNPFQIKFEIKQFFIKHVAFDADKTDTLNTSQQKSLFLGEVCPDKVVSKKFIEVNTGHLPLNLDIPVLNGDPGFNAAINGIEFRTDEADTVTVSFSSANLDTGRYETTIYIKSLECPEIIDSVLAYVYVVDTYFEFEGETDLGQINVGETSSTRIVVRKKGRGTAIISSLPTLNPPFSIVSSEPPIPPDYYLGANDSLILNIEFAPTASGDFTELVNILSDDFDANICPGSVSFTLLGNGAKPELSSNTDSIYFGINPWCGEVEEEIILTNKGAGDVTITEEPQITGIDSDMFIISSRPVESIPIKLGPDASVSYYVRFISMPDRFGNMNAIFEVKTNDPENPLIEVKLNGDKEEIDITIDPSPLDLGNIAVGATGSATAKFTNNGTILRDINNYETDDLNVSVSPPGAPLNPNGGTADFEVLYSPDAEGQVRDTIMFIINDPCQDTLYLPIVANGITATVVIPDTLDFGTLAPCGSKLDSIEIANTGEADMQLTGATISSQNSEKFSVLTTNFPIDIPAGESVYIQVDFNAMENPDGFYYSSVELEFDMNGTTVRQNVVLKAEIYSGLLAYPNPIDLGAVPVGSSNSGLLKVLNIGKADFDFINVTSPTLSSIFSMNPVEVKSQLLIGDSLVFNIDFTPQAEQQYTDSVTFHFVIDTCDIYKTVIITGYGGSLEHVKIWLPKVEVSPDIDNYQLKLYGQLMPKGDPDTIRYITAGFKTTISFDASLYYPENAVNGTITDDFVLNDYRHVDIEFDDVDIYERETVIGILEGPTLLGAVSFTPLLWNNFEWNEAGVIDAPEMENGSLSIIICREGGDRLLARTEAMMTIINPNPAGDETELTLRSIETGYHKAELVSLRGERIKLAEWNVNLNGNKEKRILLDTDRFASGMYYLIFSSNARRVVERLFIVK